jgi:hypothetical protein
VVLYGCGVWYILGVRYVGVVLYWCGVEYSNI